MSVPRHNAIKHFLEAFSFTFCEHTHQNLPVLIPYIGCPICSSFTIIWNTIVCTHYKINLLGQPPFLLVGRFNNLGPFTHSHVNLLPNDNSFAKSKLLDVVDDNFHWTIFNIFWSFSVENIVGNEEIACHKQFLHFGQCLPKPLFCGASISVNVWERVKGGAIWNFLCNADSLLGIDKHKTSRQRAIRWR